MSLDLDQLKAGWPKLDVSDEYRRARLKYGNVTLGWFALNWLHRARPVKRHRRTKADRDAHERAGTSNEGRTRSPRRTKADRDAHERAQAWAIAAAPTDAVRACKIGVRTALAYPIGANRGWGQKSSALPSRTRGVPIFFPPS